MRGNGVGSVMPAAAHAAAQNFSTTAKTDSRRGNDISRSTCVNSSWRSARWSSSRQPRALGRGLIEDRRLDLEKALARKALAHRTRDLMAHQEIALHLGAAQIDI